ncbi:MAG: hypothetical protein AB8G77_26705 [Rhodothermales bacterium]
MSDKYEANRDVWEFEAYLASDHKVWRSKAHDMRQSAELLAQYDAEVFEKVFKDREQPRLPPFWTAGPARMMMGFALENLFKALLLKNPEHLRNAFSKEGNLSWGKDGHNLIKLSEEAGFNWGKKEQRYLELWQMCATWAGRYPLPSNENQLPRQRKGLPSREALLKRSQKRIKKAIETSDPFMGAELWDQLHTGLGGDEFSTSKEIYDDCLSRSDQK